MDILKQADLQQLLGTSGEKCLSLYMPTHRAGQDQQQDPIRFKNLLAEAGRRLIENGLRKTDAREFLRPAEELLAEFEKLSSEVTQPESASFFGRVKEFLDGLGSRGSQSG